MEQTYKCGRLWIKLGEILRCKKGIWSTPYAAWIETGDLVKVVKVYPYCVLVEKVKEGSDPVAGVRRPYHMRECFARYCLHMTMKKV